VQDTGLTPSPVLSSITLLFILDTIKPDSVFNYKSKKNA